MVKTFNITMMGIGILALVALGCLGVFGALYPSVFLTLGDLIAGPLAYAVEGVSGRVLALVAGLLLVVAPVAVIWGNIKNTRRERTVVLQNPLGEVKVSLPAIEDFARVLKGRIEGLRDIKGRVLYGRKGLRVSARISLYSDYNIADVTQKVQDGVRHYVQNTLGIDQDINPTVVVTKVVNRDKPEPPAAIKPAKASTVIHDAGETRLR